jgi:hypothetical protein
MSKLDTQEKLRRAAELLSSEGIRGCDTALLLQAWEYLKGLRNDDFPAEMHPAFSFLQHEIARAHSEDLSAREAVFLAEKIRRLERMWLDNAYKSLDARVI